jgi:hypothetical protein
VSLPFGITVKLPFVNQGLALVGLCLLSAALPSCAHHRSTDSPRGSAQVLAFNAIPLGANEAEVRRLLGSPDEIRVLQGEQVLDGTVVYDSRPGKTTNQETHRWAYGPSLPGTFARGGIASFDASNEVIWAESPVWRAGGVFNEIAEAAPPEAPSAPKRLSCRIDEVRLSESPDKTSRSWLVKVSIMNDGNEGFSTDCYVDSIGRLVVIEVCDERNTPIFRVDRNHLNNGFYGRSSVVTLAAGSARTEEVYFEPENYFGRLVPGTYRMRAFFRWRAGRFIMSELVPVEVPAFPEGAYWDRF